VLLRVIRFGSVSTGICAVHIDVIPDVSADTFVHSLKRFCARRGTLLVIISDNAKTFKAAAKVIQDIITNPDVKNTVLTSPLSGTSTLALLSVALGREECLRG